jgi:nucleoside-diphosphate-sugar epimerase
MKFGSTGQEPLTWAMNVYLPALVCERYARSHIAAFSTGNVYGLVPCDGGGSVENDPPNPAGEYAISCLGRERIFEHFSLTNHTPVAILRLNYATELRYGVLVDLAKRVWNEHPVDLAMGSVNVIWQGDACAMTLCALADCASPAFILNVAGPELLRVREICERLGDLLGKPPRFIGAEGTDALLNNGSAGHQRYGLPQVDAWRMLHWVADWVRRGGALLGKPTHFEVRDGKF